MDEELPDDEGQKGPAGVRELRRRLLTLKLLVVAIFVIAAALAAGCGGPAPARVEREERRERVVRLAAVGDVLLARGVGRRIAKDGPEYPFTGIREAIRGADLAFFNLECALSTRGTPYRRRFQFRADPALAGTLSASGFDVASLANNHTMDFGRDALLDTIDAVRESGMTPVGAGRNRDEALRVEVVERKGLKVGFLAYTDVPTGGEVRLGDRPTVAGCNADEVPAQVRRARAACDVLVVSFHWGIEYMTRPTERQANLARLCIDNGADLVLGHHPHVLQTTEVYKGKPVVYSMGAFVWDPILPKTDRSAIYLFDLSPSSARLVRTVPVRIVGCRPELSEE